MSDKENIFDLKIGNIPVLNLRDEFNKNHKFILSTFAEEYVSNYTESIQTPYGVWTADSDKLMTYILQGSILGLEAFLPYALKIAAVYSGNLSQKFNTEISKAFDSATLFKKLPSVIHPNLSLMAYDKVLYDHNCIFYKVIRNPLFHGNMLNNPSIEGMRNGFNHINQIYEWIDSWYIPIDEKMRQRR